MILYETTPGGLYPQPGRTVSTFASGLIRVDQSYVCADINAASARSALAVGNTTPLKNGSPILHVTGLTVGGLDLTFPPLVVTPTQGVWSSTGAVDEPSSGNFYIVRCLPNWPLNTYVGVFIDGEESYFSEGTPSSMPELATDWANSNCDGIPVITRTYAPDADTAPAIDGLYIFPAPQEDRRGDGFTEFKVSAYGRVSTSVSGLQLTPNKQEVGSLISFKFFNIACSKVINPLEILEYEDLNIDPDLINPFDFQIIDPANHYNSLTTNGGLPYVVEYGVKGSTDSNGRYISRSYKKWSLCLTSQTGANEGSNGVFIYVKIYNPDVTVKSHRNFGSFVETDIELTLAPEITIQYY